MSARNANFFMRSADAWRDVRGKEANLQGPHILCWSRALHWEVSPHCALLCPNLTASQDPTCTVCTPSRAKQQTDQPIFLHDIPPFHPAAPHTTTTATTTPRGGPLRHTARVITPVLQIGTCSVHFTSAHPPTIHLQLPPQRPIIGQPAWLATMHMAGSQQQLPARACANHVHGAEPVTATVPAGTRPGSKQC
jgi:hypothetical protein